MSVETTTNSLQSIRIKKRVRETISAILYHLLVGAVGLVMLYPIVWMFSSSLKERDEIWDKR